ncbi:MAG: hypothetical protein ACK2U1_06410 [Anaerolineales bacterium]|jgi:hypothetical protein
MNLYQQPLWGYELEFPQDWVHQTIQDTEGFARLPEALQPNYDGEKLGHLLIRGEWNWSRQPIEPLWNQHITKLSVMLGAKKLGSAPWALGDGRGFEAEILLPKKANKRLWIGILAYGSNILHFLVTHWKEERAQFEPLVTRIIQSLHFVDRVPNITINDLGCPIPPDYVPTDPKDYLNDIEETTFWQAYHGQASVGALQAFYLRELPNYNWRIDEYVPYPAQTNLGFARFNIHRNEQTLMLGILPLSTKIVTSSVVIKK